MRIVSLAVIGASLLLVASALAETVPRALPGLEPFPAAVQQQLARALQAKGETYTPRTRHLSEDVRPHYTNRLILEPSPYLLQHAHNPVNWYPWGEEAFALAKKENKPVFLSIGYSTCHWCHVMERESFEDVAIAEYLNRHYIAIKVDREQRPDVDGVYMAAVHMLTGRGGWPLSVWLTPERQPFYGGTYFPPRDGMRGQPTGLLTLLTRLQAAYHQEPDQVATVAKKLTQDIRAALVPEESLPEASAEHPTRTVLAQAAEQFAARFDPQYGGFGKAPKFPRSVTLEFLLRYSRRTDDPEVREHGRCKPWRPWRPVGYTIRSAADFTAMPRINNGACRISRKCCTTTRCSPSPILKGIKSPGGKTSPVSPGRSWRISTTR